VLNIVTQNYEQQGELSARVPDMHLTVRLSGYYSMWLVWFQNYY